MKTTLLLGACTIGMLSVGCLQEHTYLDPDQNAGFTNSSSSTMSLRDGALRGDFGDRRGFNGEATRLEGQNDPAYNMTTVNVVREQENLGAGMVILSISGRTLDKLDVGEHPFSYDDTFDNTEIYVNVCGGDADAFDYDQPARNGTVTIQDSPNGLRTVDIHTETPVLDPQTGVETGATELSDSSFSFPMQQG